MACEKYSAWIADAAFGTLAPERVPELLAHTASCDACREAYQHAREVADFVDRGVESLVSGEPSPHFNFRLRARIAEEPAPSRLRRIPWAPVAAGALALAAVLLILLLRSPQAANPNRVAEMIAGNPSPAASFNPSPQPIPVASSHHASPIRSTHPHNLPAQGPKVLVEPGQLDAVMRLADSLRAGRVDAAQLVAAQQPLEKAIAVAPIEIPALDVSKDETTASVPSEESSHR